MSLFANFQRLNAPLDTESIYALTIDKFPYAKVGITDRGFATLLLSGYGSSAAVAKNIRLQYIEIKYNASCTVSENGESRTSYFNIVTFKSDDDPLIEYFFRVIEAYLASLSTRPSNQEMFERLKGIIEIFRVLSEPPAKTLQGLWSELLVIHSAQKPRILLEYWHNCPDESFDFNSEFEKIEVKSTSRFERVHFFSAQQLNPPVGSTVVVASLFTQASRDGVGILELCRLIEIKIQHATELIDKLYFVVSKTLGQNVSQISSVRFDMRVALQSLRFYKHEDLSRIKDDAIPDEVSDVKFKSDLSTSLSVHPNQLNGKTLFSAL